MSNFEQQKTKIRTQPGFIAALDQSGGSTPKALKLYGIAENTYSGETQMMDLIHQMRTRIITSPAFTGERIARRDPVRGDHGSRDRGHARPPTTCGRSRRSCRS